MSMPMPPGLLAALGPGPGAMPTNMPGPGLGPMNAMPTGGPPMMGGMPPGLSSLLPGSDAGPIPGLQGLQPPPPLPPGPMGGPGAPPPGMQAMMQPPPEAMTNPLDDPLVMQLLHQTFEQKMLDAEESKKGPFHPSWYEDTKNLMYPKPSATDMLEKINRDYTRFTPLLDRFQDDLDLLSTDANLTGTFGDFDPETEEAFYVSALVSEKNLIKAKIGGVDPIFESLCTKPKEQGKRQDVEDFLYALDAEAERQYTSEFGGSRRMALADDSLVYGRMIQRNLPNWKGDDDRIPFSMRLMDPSTVFPTFGGPHGLETVTVQFVDPLRSVIRAYPRYSKEIREKVMSKQTDRSDKFLMLDDDVRVSEFWDRRHFALFVEDELIIGPWEHDLGEPPFVYVITERGNSTHTIAPRDARTRGRNGSTVTRRSQDIIHQGESFIAARRRTHAQKEAILGTMMTQMRNKTNPALIIEQDDFAMEKGMPEITGARGGRSQTWKNHEEAKGWPERADPTEYGPLLQAASEDLSREGMPPTSYGINRNSNVSGFALDELNSAGMDKMAPDLIGMQHFYQACNEQILRMVMNFGHLLGKKGERGAIKVPRLYPDKSKGRAGDMATVSSYTVRCVGVQTMCKMNAISIQDMGPLANTVQMLVNMKVIERADILRLMQLPGYRNPEQKLKQVDLDEMKQQPEYKLAQLIKYLIEEENDEVTAAFLAKQLAQGRMKEQQANGGAPNGVSPGAPAPVPPQPMGGISLPSMGQPPGPGSGPPPGPPPGLPGMM